MHRCTELNFGGLRIDPPLLLAPMAGLSHSALRQVLSDGGGVGLYSTEMLSARSLPVEAPSRSPYLLRTPCEHPLSYQLLVAEPQEVAPALAVLHALDAQAADLNCGCPAPLIRRRGGGSRLMEEPERACRVVREARRRTRLPLSAKIRLGERLDEPSLLDFVKMLEAEGVDLVTVHARLRAEPYGRPPRWDWVGKVKRALRIPVVANGGIFGIDDARRCLRVSGCDGLMLGRGAVVRPWLFAEITEQLWGRRASEGCRNRPRLFRAFAEALERTFPPERRLGRLKEFTFYFSQTYPFGHTLRSAVQASTGLDEACSRAEAFFARHDTDCVAHDPRSP